MAGPKNQGMPDPGDEELTSRRLFLPQTDAPHTVEVYRDLLKASGLWRHARKLAFEHLKLAGNESLLHVGCGRGSLTLKLKKRYPSLDITGIEADENNLATAAEDAESDGLHVLFQKGYFQDLPTTTERHDVVLCVLALSRVTGGDRGEAFEEIRRVLKPGGQLLAVDIGASAPGVRGLLVRRLALHQKGLADHLALGLEEIFRFGGMEGVSKLAEGPFGLQVVGGRKSER